MGVLLIFSGLVLLVAVVFLLGFCLGHDASQEERTLEIRRDVHDAERQLSDLTRQAFVAMTEHVERRRDR